ncbi:baseplate J/gp47 family protein [Acetobacter cibinongensis]|uniref:Uncharacterized protein n=1 Tax=Acetobacter cibinongensis TaxID=146475 RepID=A0A1Z5YW44_9PROT|nr:baseplate J/gp47 family protein [Acetobacter cibinongensis]OUJ03205.1 hypothetical protein HK14_03340 [Acetobacter cibinongensis]
MPYQRPTLTQLRQQAQQDVLDGGIADVSALLRFSVINVLSMVMAGFAWLHYGYLDWIAKQAVPWTATGEYLAAWGALKGIFLKSASASTGTVAFPVSGNSIIPAGTAIILSGGLSGQTTQDSVTQAGQTTALVQCTETGAAGNISAGAIATLSSPVEGVQTVGTVTLPFTGGADTETQEAFRTRVLNAFQNQGGYGEAADYKEWATAVSGITRCWVYPNMFGTGSVVIYVMLDNANAATNGLPIGTDGAATNEPRFTTASGDQLRVANAIWEKQPATPLVIVCAPVGEAVDFVVSDLGVANTAANKQAIQSALADMFQRLSGPGVTLHENNWDEAIAAIGLESFSVSSPKGSISPSAKGNMLVLGTVTTQD